MIKNNKNNSFLSNMTTLQKTFVVCSSLLLLIYAYSFILFVIVAMLPTIIVYITDKTNKDKQCIVGLFNFAGASYWIVKVFFSGFSQDISTMLYNVLFWISSYGFASMGFYFYYKVPELLIYFIKKYNDYKLTQIDKNLEKLENEWGEL